MVNKRARINKTRSSKALVAKSAAIVGSNDDLLTEILRRLPVTSILRFKSVSKHWHSLLSNQRFTLSYDKVLVSPGFFLNDLYIPFDVENPSPPPFRTRDFYPNRSSFGIMQSCNGLLLCRSKTKYYVINPTTNQYVVVPSVIGGSDVRSTIYFMGLAFHPLDYVHYKVVCLRTVSRYGKLFQIQIYSSDTRKWRISQQSLCASDFTSDSTAFYYGFYWNGAMHWIPELNEMVYFKLDEEQLKTMALPQRVSSSRREVPLYFGESGGHMHLVDDTRKENPLHLNVYELLSDYSGWFVKYRVDLDNFRAVCSSQGTLQYLFEAFDVVRGEDEESAFMVVKNLDKIMRYNFVNKRFEHIFDLPSNRRIWYTNVHRYIQTLYPLR